MVEKNKIIIGYFTEGKNISELSRELKITRNTVRKYIKEQKRLNKSKELEKTLTEGLITKPKYKVNNRKKIKLTKEVVEIIKLCLKENEKKRQQHMRKQQMKKIDIYEKLTSLGYNIGYTTVCNYIREYENRTKEAFIKQKYSPAKTCEFDWGEVKIEVEGKWKKYNMAVFTSAYSNHRFAKLFNRQDSLAFVQSHVDYFEQTGYVFKEMVYDNMRVAIARFVGTAEQRATNSLLEMSNYYQFGYRFCNIRRGNEKGHVERSVEYIRRKAFSITSKFSSLNQANEYLQTKCKELNAKPQKTRNNQSADLLFEEEKTKLQPAKQAYQCFEQSMVKVDKYSTITVQGNHYSVPDYLVSKVLVVRVFAQKILVLKEQEIVSRHLRSYGFHSWTINIEHYIPTFKMKPGALKGSVALEQLDNKMQSVFHSFFLQDVKGFIELIQKSIEKEITISEILKAIDKLKRIAPNSINKDTILATIDKFNEENRLNKAISKNNSDIQQYSQATLKRITQTLN